MEKEPKQLRQEKFYLVLSNTRNFFTNFEDFIRTFLQEDTSDPKNPPYKYLSPSHYGAVIHQSEKTFYLSNLAASGFYPYKQFSSQIIRQYLEKKYNNRKIKVDILKFRDSDSREIELFVPNEELTEDMVDIESSFISHFAVSINSTEDGVRHSVSRMFKANGFLFSDGGTNTEEHSTIEYYSKLIGNSIMKFELFRFY